MFGYQSACDALRFARDAHDGQTRKYIKIDYIIHPMRVASLVAHYLDFEGNPRVQGVVIPAALLHDVIEDCDVTHGDVANEFGFEIADLVMEVTNPSIHRPDLNREDRKKMDREHLSHSSYFGASIKLADIIDNCTDIVAYDPSFAKVYLKEKKKALEVLGHGNTQLYQFAEDTVYVGLDQLKGENRD